MGNAIHVLLGLRHDRVVIIAIDDRPLKCPSRAGLSLDIFRDNTSRSTRVPAPC
jgi:hypothetical protein